jgi:hypothetical protein
MLTGVEQGMIIEIYDYTGRKISFQLSINIYNQPNGVYLIRILSKSGKLVSQVKVVKVQ